MKVFRFSFHLSNHHCNCVKNMHELMRKFALLATKECEFAKALNAKSQLVGKVSREEDFEL